MVICKFVTRSEPWNLKPLEIFHSPNISIPSLKKGTNLTAHTWSFEGIMTSREIWDQKKKCDKF